MKSLLLMLVLYASLCTLHAQEAPFNNAEEVPVPCLQESFDTEDAVAAWGVGKSTDRRESAMLAIQDAIAIIAQRFHINSTAIEPYANQWCRTTSINANNECVTYVSIHVPKTIIYNAISVGK
ncbi:MAG: hypothetical protein IJT12_00070 [Paludibacteraceae bacterium]|nr:hypothetical protein [Paludibacteraceae bacterium]